MRMAVEFNHTIVHATDSVASATFLTELLGLPSPTSFSVFQVVKLDNGVSLDFIDTAGPVRSRHFAFLISEPEFDTIFGRIKQRGIAHWADPGQTRAGEINHHDGGRGVYFEDLDGHLLEIITRPYGSGG